MSFFKKAKRAVKHYMTMKAVRKKIGLTGKNKFFRQLKRGLKGRSVLSSPVSTSAVTEGYQYQPRSISSLIGGR